MSLTKEEFEKVFEYISKIGGKGSQVQSIYEQMRGINSLGTHPTMPPQREQFGLTFFTRPRLNLSDANLRAWRPFYNLIGGESTVNLPRAIRALLDPVGVWRNDKGSPLCNNAQAFIPWLSNGLVSQSGWPEIAPGTFTSQEGNHHEAWSMIDDTIKNYRVWELNTSLRNGPGNIILLLLYVWVCYAGLIYEGDLTPYADAIMQNRIDYHTRIYRFSLDPNKKRIAGWWSTVAYPYVVPSATGANFSMDNPFNTESQQLSVNWKCHGCETFDPIIFHEFNTIGAYFNYNMHDSMRDTHMQKLTEDEFTSFTYDMYYRVEPEEQELERWVDKEVYQAWTNEKAIKMSARFSPLTLEPVAYGGELPSQNGTVTTA